MQTLAIPFEAEEPGDVVAWVNEALEAAGHAARFREVARDDHAAYFTLRDEGDPLLAAELDDLRMEG